MYEIAEKYFKHGLSVVALDELKMPLGKWKARQNELIPPTDIFKNAYGVGILCGKVSGGLECLDIDCKYDLTGNLMERYQDAVAQRTDVLNRVVIEKTAKGGYHVLYRCHEIGRNQKLAQRYATSEEKKEKGENIKVLLETRGEGGYFMCAPTKGYEVIYGDLLSIPEITTDERRILLECAKIFNEVLAPEGRREIKYDGRNIFEEYGETADIPALLQDYGWTYKGMCDGNMMFKRPGDSDSVWSGGYHPDKKLFTVFSTSTIFDQLKGYSPAGVLCMLKFNGDWRECAAWLREKDYGKQEINKTENKHCSELFSDINSSHEYLRQVRDGTLKMGMSTGFEGLDVYWRLKESHLVVINGVDNVGKSQVMWYLYVLAALRYGWNFLIYAGENPNSGSVFRKLMEFYLCKTLQEMTNEEYEKAKKFISDHFTIIKNKSIFTVKDMIDLGDKALQEKKYNVFLIDPYNSLYRDKAKGMNPHDYDYEALGIIRQWVGDTTCSCHIICHSATEALRKYYPKDHPLYANLIMPPNKGDTEGGGKFSNRADDFLTIHRHAQSDNQWMWTEIYNRKNRDNDTGGRQTPFDKPFRMKMNSDRTGFEDEKGYNPVTKIVTKKIGENYYEASDGAF